MRGAQLAHRQRSSHIQVRAEGFGLRRDFLLKHSFLAGQERPKNRKKGDINSVHSHIEGNVHPVQCHNLHPGHEQGV